MSRRRGLRIWWRLLGTVGLALVFAALAALGASASFMVGFRERAADSVYPRGELDPSVIVVGIDDKSLDEVGLPWPWPRELQAELLGKVKAGDPRVAVVDLVYAPPAEGDEALAETIGESPMTVVAMLVSAIALSDNDVVMGSLVTPPSDVVAKNAALLGHTAVVSDPNDGVVRSVPLVVEVDRIFVPSLALAAFAATEGLNPNVIIRPGGVQLGDRTIPTESGHRLRVNWPEGLDSRNNSLVISASDVLLGKVPSSTFRDKTVFLGVTAPSLGDQHLIPVAKSSGDAGVLIQAAAYNTLITRTFMETASVGEQALTVFIVALIVGLAVQFLPVWAASVVSLFVPVAASMFGLYRSSFGIVPNFVYPVIAVAAMISASGGLRYATEVRRRLEVNRLFSQYVPKPVADQLIEEGRVQAATRGERAEISVLFCDLRGFTAMCAQLDPAEVNERLTEYYEYASRIVLESGGTLMQYVGDEVFAIFGAPMPQPDHAERAVICAKRLQEDVDLLDERVLSGELPPLRFGIGVNCGKVVAAHAGSTWRRQYTVIGDAVNVGSRLCSHAGPGQVVVADDVLLLCSAQFEVESMGPLSMKGVSPDFKAWKLVLDRVPSGTEDREAGQGK